MFRTAIRLAAVALVAFTTVAEAQTRPVFGVAAGITAPQGDFGDAVENGYHIGAAVGFKVPVLPVALRGDLAYTMFDGADDVDLSVNTLNLSVNAVHAFPGVAIRPYVIGGLGMYRSTSEFLGEEETSTDLGLNGGAGIQFKLAGMQSFVEARYTHIMTEDEATKVIPISFGIMF
jgi:hypothetical protein